ATSQSEVAGTLAPTGGARATRLPLVDGTVVHRRRPQGSRPCLIPTAVICSWTPCALHQAPDWMLRWGPPSLSTFRPYSSPHCPSPCSTPGSVRQAKRQILLR